MRKFLLSLFVLLNVILYYIKEFFKIAGMVFKEFGLYFKRMYILRKKQLITKIKNIENTFVSTVISLFRFLFKISYVYPALAFLICLFITIVYPNWFWTDYTWIGFFFILMFSLVLITIKEG